MIMGVCGLFLRVDLLLEAFLDDHMNLKKKDLIKSRISNKGCMINQKPILDRSPEVKGRSIAGGRLNLNMP
jgi:hypothetical protein